MDGIDHKQALSKELIKVLWVLLAASLLFRLWPLVPVLLLLILGQGIRICRLEYLKSRRPVVNPVPEGFRIPQAREKPEVAVQITELVHLDYPGASWVWEVPSGEKELLEHHKTVILLNGAGGYRKGTVTLSEQGALTLSFRQASKPVADAPAESDSVPEVVSEAKEDPSMPENYGLIAFEWVDAHLMELDHLCNEAIGRGEDCVLIPGEDLPSRESWEEVCRELARNALENTRITPEGVRIILTR